MSDDSYTTWSDLTLVDARTGRHPVVRAQAGYRGYGTQPYSITRRTVQGQKFLEATWMPSGSRATFERQADAVAFIQAHEEIAYGVPRRDRNRRRVQQRDTSRCGLLHSRLS